LAILSDLEAFIKAGAALTSTQTEVNAIQCAVIEDIELRSRVAEVGRLYQEQRSAQGLGVDEAGGGEGVKGGISGAKRPYNMIDDTRCARNSPEKQRA